MIVSSLRRLGSSMGAIVGLTGLALVLLVLAAVPFPLSAVAPFALLLIACSWWVGRLRPGPIIAVVVMAGLMAMLLAFVRDGRVGGWVVLTAVTGVFAGLIDEPLDRRLVPAVRAVQLPGVRSDERPQLPGPLAAVPMVATVALSVHAIGLDLHWPAWVRIMPLVVTVLTFAWCARRLWSEVQLRRNTTANRQVTAALTAYAPQFLIYFSGPIQGDYQVRMWLPYLEKLDVPFAVLVRDPRMLARGRALTDRPVIACQRLGGLDDVMVPSVRAVFYVNTDRDCVDGVRYLDRTHVHLNHGDSDKPSSYHPMIGMFDRIFLAGQAAVDRFERHGVVVPDEKFRLVGRPQVAGTTEVNTDPLPDVPTVFYAPTWRGGVKDMSFSSLSSGVAIVQALIDRGVRVIFRPHPLSIRDRESSVAVARIDALLTATSTERTPHLTSSMTADATIKDLFNTSDALVTDVSSVASDYLRSGKPLAVADLGATGPGQRPDPVDYPVLNAAYLLDVTGLDGEAGAVLDLMLREDPLRERRTQLRHYYLGDHQDEVATFVREAQAALHTPM